MAVIGRHALGVDAVLPDNEAGGRALGDHLLELGHRRIAVAAGTARPDHGGRPARRGGARRCARTACRMADLPWCTPTSPATAGRAAAEQIMREHPETTAIIALNDAMAMGVLSDLRELRIRYRRRCRWWASTTCRWRRTWRPA